MFFFKICITNIRFDFRSSHQRCSIKNLVNLIFNLPLNRCLSLIIKIKLRWQVFGFWKKKKTLWPLFMDGVQLPQGYSHFEEAVHRNQKGLLLSPVYKHLKGILQTWPFSAKQQNSAIFSVTPKYNELVCIFTCKIYIFIPLDLWQCFWKF